MSLELGKKIAVLRKMQEVTQAQLADYLMVQPQTVSRWESEGGTPDVTLLPRIAAFFDVSLDELFGLVGSCAGWLPGGILHFVPELCRSAAKFLLANSI